MNGNGPDGGFVNTALMGLWALGGAVARGMSDWVDPVSGKFTAWRAVSGLVTAVVLGEVAIGLTTYMNWDPLVTGALAAVLGYIGPAATIGILTKAFEDKHDDAPKPKP